MIYDVSPSEGTPYPFIHLGEQFKQNVRESKDHLRRPTQLTVHVWHNTWTERGVVTSMMFQIESAVIDHFGIDGENISSQMIPDTTTSTKLVHGILEIEIGGI